VTRKPFDDSTGKHTTSQPTLPISDIFETATHVKRAYEVTCPECMAWPSEKCSSIVDASVTLEVPHSGRIEAARTGP
jgi:hypothetical protein